MLRLDRRDFVGLAGAFASVQLLQGCAPVRGMAPPAGDAGSELLLSGIAEQLLAEYPENATALGLDTGARAVLRSEEHTSELQSLMRTSYAVFRFKTKIT